MRKRASILTGWQGCFRPAGLKYLRLLPATSGWHPEKNEAAAFPLRYHCLSLVHGRSFRQEDLSRPNALFRSFSPASPLITGIRGFRFPFLGLITSLHGPVRYTYVYKDSSTVLSPSHRLSYCSGATSITLIPPFSRQECLSVALSLPTWTP
jgi:hypothetical protein